MLQIQNFDLEKKLSKLEKREFVKIQIKINYNIIKMTTTTNRRDYTCNVIGEFTKSDERDLPDKALVEQLAFDYPNLPHWMISAAVHFHNKNPHYLETGQFGKKPPTGKQKRMYKRETEVLHPFIVGPEWYGPTPDEHEPISQEEAKAMANDSNKPLVSAEAVVKPVKVDVENIQEIVSKI